MQRSSQRQGFIVSVLVHLTVIMVLASHQKWLESPNVVETPPPEVRERVFLPPVQQLRRLMPLPKEPPPPLVRQGPLVRPTPPPPRPPDEKLKDKVSIGAASDGQRKPIILRKDQSLLDVAKGTPNATSAAPPAQAAPPSPPPPSSEAQQAKAGGTTETKSTGFHLPTGLGDLPRGQDGSQKGAREEPSIARYVANLDRRLQEQGQRGVSSGTNQRMGPFNFDPEGADFTAWTEHLRIELINNWNIPKPAELGYHGHVDFAFTVERDGTVSNVTMLKGSGTPAFDKAARNALLGSNALPLPSDYRPPRLTIEVGFYYNEVPAGS